MHLLETPAAQTERKRGCHMHARDATMQSLFQGGVKFPTGGKSAGAIPRHVPGNGCQVHIR